MFNTKQSQERWERKLSPVTLAVDPAERQHTPGTAQTDSTSIELQHWNALQTRVRELEQANGFAEKSQQQAEMAQRTAEERASALEMIAHVNTPVEAEGTPISLLPVPQLAFIDDTIPALFATLENSRALPDNNTIADSLLSIVEDHELMRLVLSADAEALEYWQKAKGTSTTALAYPPPPSEIMAFIDKGFNTVRSELVAPLGYAYGEEVKTETMDELGERIAAADRTLRPFAKAAYAELASDEEGRAAMQAKRMHVVPPDTASSDSVAAKLARFGHHELWLLAVRTLILSLHASPAASPAATPRAVVAAAPPAPRPSPVRIGAGADMDTGTPLGAILRFAQSLIRAADGSTDTDGMFTAALSWLKDTADAGSDAEDQLKDLCVELRSFVSFNLT